MAKSRSQDEPGSPGRKPQKKRSKRSARRKNVKSRSDEMVRISAAGESPATVIYVHGLGSHPEPASLKRQWDESLFGRPLGERTRFAYYADILHPFGTEGSGVELLAIPSETSLFGAESAEAAEAVVRSCVHEDEGVEWGTRMMERMLGARVAMQGEEFNNELKSFASETASHFSARVLPPGRFRRFVTERITRAFIQDVAAYFFEAEIRERIQERLLDLLIPDGGPYVLVTHSMGTIVSYDVVSQLSDNIEIAQWVTLGSPLGISEVQDHLVPNEPLTVPTVVREWQNFADRLDPVALDPVFTDEYEQDESIPTSDTIVLNPHTLRFGDFNPHSSTGYLSHKQVRRVVAGVVGSNFSAPTTNFVMAFDIAAEAAGAPQRHDILIQLNDTSDGATLKKRAKQLKREIRELAGDDADATEVDCLRRYVAAKLTPRELQILRSRHDDLAIERLWKNNTKSALLETSTHRLQARTAQIGYRATGKNIAWAVLDTGIAANHPHFLTHDNIVAAWDCTSAGSDGPVQGGEDGHGHGTHVAGIIAGQDPSPEDPDQARFAIAPLTKLHIYKVLSDQGGGRDSWIIKALDHIAEVNEQAGEVVIHGVNLSLGGSFDPEVFGCGHSPICQELRRLWRMGVVVCVAAGNEGVANLYEFDPQTRKPRVSKLNADLSIGDPANLDEAIAVGSVHKEFPHLYGVSHFSSRGPTADGRVKPDVVAPGEKIMSCNARFIPEEAETFYMPESGTSMACPHVSGLIAAFLSVRREFIGRPDEVKRLLLEHAIDLGRNQYHQGAGLPNLIQMLAGT